MKPVYNESMEQWCCPYCGINTDEFEYIFDEPVYFFNCGVQFEPGFDEHILGICLK